MQTTDTRVSRTARLFVLFVSLVSVGWSLPALGALTLAAPGKAIRAIRGAFKHNGASVSSPRSAVAKTALAAKPVLTGGRAPLAAVIASAGATLVSEGCTPANGALDPGETVTVSFCIQNVGSTDTTSALQGTLQATGGVTNIQPPNPQTYGVVNAGGPAVCQNFTFTVNGTCGGTVTATIHFQDGATEIGDVTYTFTLGVDDGRGGFICCGQPTPPMIVPAGATIVSESCTPANGALDPGETVTVSLCVQNIGGTTTSALQGTLQATGGVTNIQGTNPQNYGAVSAGGQAVCRNFTFTVNGTCGGTVIATVHFQDGATDFGDVTYTFTLGVNNGMDTYVCATTCTPPCVITCPPNITQSNDPNQCGVVITYSGPMSSGTCGTITCTPPSTSFFPVGTTTVTCQATGFPAPTCNFTVTINDAQPPTLTCPASFAVATDSAGGRAVTYTNPTASDNCPGATVTCTPASGSNFPVGVSTVTCTAKDTTNNTASCSFNITVNRVTFSLTDPLACTGPGNTVSGAFNIPNASGVAVGVTATVALPAGLVGVANSCTANFLTSCTVSNNSVSYTAVIPPGQTATVNYLSQLGDGVALNTQLCAALTVTYTGGGAPLTLQACVTVNCPTVGPGSPFLATGEVSDQKAGSVLVYNLYSSSVAAPNAQNTRISITNTNPGLPIAVHLFFVDGATCSIADSLVCLTPNQTASFLASDIDPGTTGCIVAVASSLTTGCPVDFNFLIGDAYVKLSSGHAANLAAEAFAAIAGGLPACNALSVTALLSFDGTSYNRAPRVLAASNLPSRADNNDTLIVLNRLGGSLAAGASTLGSLFGVLYDDAENPLSFTFTASVCQFRSSLSSNFPRVAPRFENFIPAGRSGWAKFYSQSDVALLGAQINFNPNAGTAANAFNQGHNLHKLTLTSAAVLTVPVFPPNC